MRGSHPTFRLAPALLALLTLLLLAPGADAAYPGSEGEIAYLAPGETKTVPESERLHILDPATGTNVEPAGPGGCYHTFSSGVTGQVTWSPNGTKLAFVGGSECTAWNTEGPVIVTTNAKGEDMTAVTKTLGVPLFSPTWLPDGKELAYIAEKPSCREQLHIVTLADGSETSPECISNYSSCSTTFEEPVEVGEEEVFVETGTEKIVCPPTSDLVSRGNIEGRECNAEHPCGTTVAPLAWSPTIPDTYATLAEEESETVSSCPGLGICEVVEKAHTREYPIVVGPAGAVPLTGLAFETNYEDLETDAVETTSGTPVASFSWTPDGKTLLVAASDGIHEVSWPEGTETIIAADAAAQQIVASPDGSHVLYPGCLPEPARECGLVKQRLPEAGAEPAGSEPEAQLVPGVSIPEGATIDVQAQQLPIVYLPGIMASEITCGSETVWSRLHHQLNRLDLKSDGTTSANCVGAAPGEVLNAPCIASCLSSFLTGCTSRSEPEPARFQRWNSAGTGARGLRKALNASSKRLPRCSASRFRRKRTRRE